MAVGDKILIAKFNNIAARLRVARDKYYGGYAVSNDITSGAMCDDGVVNTLFSQCEAVSARSPVPKTFERVSQGALIVETTFNSVYNKINEAANCYSNCHSNCHSNCNCDCNCDRGRCPD